MTSRQIAYFGYGSLVNLETLRTPYISAHRARVKGWRRVWLERPKVEGSFAPIDGLAFLSVQPDANCSIDGLVICDHASSLTSLDEREALYERTNLPKGSIEFPDGVPEGFDGREFIYQAKAMAAGATATILRSYLDAVMQGYLQHFGETGLTDFMATTNGFEAGILEDRDEPYYPRSVRISEAEKLLFEQHVAPKA